MRLAIVSIEVPDYVGPEKSDVQEWLNNSLSNYGCPEFWNLQTIENDVDTDAWLSGFSAED